MPGHQEATSRQTGELNADSKAVALHRLRAQRRQHAGPRLHTAASVQTSRLPGVQQLQLGNYCHTQQNGAGCVPDSNSMHPTPQQQHSSKQLTISKGGQHGTGVLKTAVNNMQSRPPSRTSSARVSLELHLHQGAGMLECSPGAAVAATATMPRQQPLACTHAKRHASMHLGHDCLTVQGTGLLVQLPGSTLQQQARGATDNRVQPRVVPIQTSALRATDSSATQRGSRTLGSLGCGITWAHIKHLAVAAHQKALHLSKREHEQQRLRLARAVADQWLWWAHSRRQQQLADNHHKRQLMSAGWLGLHREVSCQQLLQYQASLQLSKHTFMLLSQCFLAWQQLLVQQQQQMAVITAHQDRWDKKLQQMAVQEWHQQAVVMHRKRQLLLRAHAHRTFMSMLRCLHAWQTWVTDQQLERLKHTRASHHWQRLMQQHVLTCWRERAIEAARKWQQLAKALCFHKHTMQKSAIRSWRFAMAHQQECRTAAAHILQQWQDKQLMQTTAHAVHAWHFLAEQQVHLRQMKEQLSYSLQQQRMQQVLRHWYSLVRYHQQLGVAADQLSAVGGMLWCRHCLGRWQCVVEVMAGQRTAELRELVQLRACVGTWLKYTEQQRLAAGKLSAATAALQHKKLMRIPPAWQSVAAALQHKRQLQALAAEHFAVQQLQRLFLLWRHNAVEMSRERRQLAAADNLHSSILLDHSWRAWHWYWWHSSMKRSVADLYMSNLQRRALAAWRDVTARKVQMEVQRRQAVRHHYLSTLSKTIAAWHEALQLSAVKQQLLWVADEHCKRQSTARTFKMWHGPFLQHQQHKRDQLAQALFLKQQQLKQQAIRTWGAAVAAGKAERAQERAADQHLRQQQQQRALRAWLEVHQREQVEQQQLALAAQPTVNALQRRMQRRVMRTWRQVTAQQQTARQQLIKAEQHHACTLLHHSMESWQHYMHQQQARAVGHQRATQHRRRKVAAAVLHRLLCHVAAAGVKRQRMFVAALHRRSWLASRAWRAWRLTSAMSRLEQAALLPAINQSVAAAQGGMISSQQQQPLQPSKPGLDAVAAAVVAASCSSLARWQQQWKQQWHGDRYPLPQPQQQFTDDDVARSVASHNQLVPQQQDELFVQHAGQLQEQVSAVVSNPVAGKPAARRPPRLPAFMQEQEQQWQYWRQTPQQSHLEAGAASNSAVFRVHLGDARVEDHHHHQQQPGVLFPAVERGRQLLQNSCSTWQGQASYLSPYRQPHHYQQEAAATCVQGAVAAMPAVVGWSTPQASKPSRPQPRQLRTAAPAAAGATVITTQSAHASWADQQQEPGQQQQHRNLIAPGQLMMYHQPQQLCHTQHQHEMADQQHQGLNHHACSDHAQVLLVHHGHQALHNMVDGSGMQTGCLQLLQHTADQGCNPPRQQEAPTGQLLPHTPCTYSSSNTSVVGQLTYSSQAGHCQQFGAPQPAAAAVPQQHVPYTPITRQMLQEEVAALERTLQHCQMLKAAVQSRQQQVQSLQDPLGALSYQVMDPGTSDLGPSQQQQQEEVELEVVEAQQQLQYVESELSELLVEQARQQPRLTAIAQRIQQLKAAATIRQAAAPSSQLVMLTCDGCQD